MSKAIETTEQKPTKVAKKESSGLIVPDNLANMFVEDAGAGQAGVGKDDLALPFIKIIQNGSPERKKSHAKFIQGTEEGDIFNNVTKEVWKKDDGIYVVPCAYRFAYPIFIPMEPYGGGILGELDPSDPIIQQAVRDENNRDMLPKEYAEKLGAPAVEMVPTAEHYVLVVDQKTGTFQEALLYMKGASRKVSRVWNTQIKMQTAKIDNRLIKLPSFGAIWHLSTVEKTKENKTWCEYSVIGRVSYVQDAEMYEQAKSFSELIESGQVKVQVDEELQGTKSTQSDDEDLFTME